MNVIRSRVFFSWLLSYTFILVMPIIVSNVVYYKANDIINQEVQTVNEIAMRQLGSILDGSLASFDRIAENLSLNDTIRKLLSYKGKLDGKFIQIILRAQDELARYQLTDDLISEIYLYAANSQTLITSTYKYNTEELSSVLRDKMGFDIQDFQQFIDQTRSDKLRMTNVKGRKKLFFVMPLYAYSFARPSGLLMVRLHENKLSQILSMTNQLNGASIFLLNSRNEQFAALGNWPISLHVSYFDMQQKESTTEMEIDSQKVIVSHVPSEEFVGEIISMIPTEVFHGKIYQMQRIMGVYVALCLLAGGALAIFFTKRNYDPLLRIHRILSKNKVEANRTTDEYKLLEKVLTELLESQTEMKTLATQRDEIKQNNVWVQILLGRIPYDQGVDELLQSVHFKNLSFVVVALRIPIDGMNKTNQVLIDKETNDIMIKTIKELGEKILGESYNIAMAEIAGEPIFILNGAMKDSANTLRTIQNGISRIIEPLHDLFLINIYADIGGIHEGHTAIADSYADTLLIQGFRQFKREPQVIIPFDLIGGQLTAKELQLMNFAEQRLFINCLEAEDYRNAYSIFQALINQEPNSYYSINLLKIRIISYAGILVNKVYELNMGKNCSSDVMETVNMFEELIKANSVTLLCINAEKLLCRTVEFLQANSQQEAPQCVLQAETYIAKHYPEASLSVASIADALGLSTSYLSRTYKKYRGQGLLEFIHQTRLSKAKELISDMSVAQVAEQVGYVDSKALINAFKRMEGVTPGKFRNLGRSTQTEK